ncbi:hypothetical protein, partial [Ralstonia pseudosolanacearum]|uniref:hypothetical protein n=1 Tax=Ralstonia pseudosolanacearum TaxID=1310165 RepID=UPI003CEAC621
MDESAQLHTYIKKEVPFRIGGSQSDSIATRLVSRPMKTEGVVKSFEVVKHGNTFYGIKFPRPKKT